MKQEDTEAAPPRSRQGLAPGDRLADRFLIRALLGSGAFGSVYAAQDLTTGAVVAIKRLTRVTGGSIYRFKREFRALADREHPNLVRFHELFFDEDEWFFSMELVEGEHFDTHVLGPRDGASPTVSMSVVRPLTVPERPQRGGEVHGDAPAAVAPPPAPPALPDLAKLRAALAQLVAGIRALHAAGVVHRDLKPGNVLVSPDGRVVLLDFGLVTESDPDAQRSAIGVVMGTPMYMAPEQALGRAATEAADWYALGVMLYEVLHGRPPFSGTSHDLLTAKLSPSAWKWPVAPSGTEDLDALCRALLNPEPAERPGGEQIASKVKARPYVPTPRTTERAPQFVGRTHELGVLHAALEEVSRGRAVVMRVHGPSGVGKSALLRQFAQSLGHDAVVLSGRCYERESVPYKTLDGVVDALTRHLGRLSVEEAALLVPRQAQALCRLFPVFGRLRLLAEQPERLRSSSPHEERRRGFAALRETLARLGDRRRLVVIIDDLQWGDLDSVAPLSELLAGADAPRLLLLLAYRSSDASSSGAVRAIATPELMSAFGDVRDLAVGPLGEADAIALAESLLPSEERERAVALAQESEGIPFFLPELVRAQRKTPGVAISLEQAMRDRMTELTPGARRLLRVVAVAARPVSRAIAFEAAALSSEERVLAADELIRSSFLRTAEDTALEPFHDRVRESVVSGMADEMLRATHDALAEAFAIHGAMDPESLAEHYRQAGRLGEARAAAVEAAERATHAFAFERAIALYRLAQDRAPSDERRMLTSRLADVLAYAGRGREAAAAYLEAVGGASPDEARELRRRAAEQMLRCGALEEGMALIRELLAAADIGYPEGRNGVLASLVKNRLLLSVRGLSFKARTLGPKDVDDVARVDLCWTLGACLSPIDAVRCADYLTRHLRAALALGEPYRVSRGMSLFAIASAAEGTRSAAAARKLALRAGEIARELNHPHAIGWSLSALSSVEWYEARWRRSLELSREATAMFRERSPESVWEIALPEVFLTHRSLFFLGELRDYKDEVERCTRAAGERGDEFIMMMAQSVGMSRVRLIEGRPDEARRVSAQGVARWPKGEWHLQHQEDLRAQLLCDAYEGDGKQAIDRIKTTWTMQQRSLIFRTLPERIMSFSLFVCAALHAGDELSALNWLKMLAKDDVPWARALYDASWAGVLALRKDPRAVAAYDKAEAALTALEMPLFAAAARRRRGELLGGEEGAALVKAVDAGFTALGITAPARWAQMLVR